jgi:hypothetical protein
MLGFDLGKANCLIILAAFSIAFRVISLMFMKLMVNKF